MWTYIENKNISNFIANHDELSEHWEMYELLKTNTITFLPRLFAKKYSSIHLIEWEGKKQITPKKVEIKFNHSVKLRPEQQKAFNVFNNILNEQGYVNGILKLPTGVGKTVLAIYLASKLGYKTAIIVNNKKLLKQWIESILKFTKLCESDIGLFSQNIISHKNKKIVLCMSQTLGSKMKDNIIKIFNEVDTAKFGLVIFDEVHASSAAQLNSKISLLFRTKNVIGLSATPFHHNYQKILMHNTIGDIIFSSKQYEIIPKFYIQFFNSELKNYKYIEKVSDFVKQRAMYNKNIVKSQKYFDCLISTVIKLRNMNKNILIICMTVDQVQLISDQLTYHNIDNELLYSKSTEIGETSNVIIATYKFAGAGLDIPRLDALIFGSPLSGQKSFIQCTGRILRKYENKSEAIVVSLFDENFIDMFLPDIKRIGNIIHKEYNEHLNDNFLVN